MTDKKQPSKYSEVSLHLSSKLEKTADGKPRKRIRCFNCRLRKDTRRSPYLLRIGCIIQGVLHIIQMAIHCVLLGFTGVTLGTAKTPSEKQSIEYSMLNLGFGLLLPIACLSFSVAGAFILDEDRRAYGEKRTWAPCFFYSIFIICSISFFLTHIQFFFYPTALQEAMYASMAYSIVTAVVPLVFYVVYLLLPRCEEKCCQCDPWKDRPKELELPPYIPPSQREGVNKQKDTDQSNSSVANEVEQKKKAIVEPENKKKEEEEGLVTGTEHTEEKKKRKEPVKEKKESAEVLYSPKEGQGDHLNMEDGYEDFGPGEEEGVTKEATVYDVDDTGDTGGLPRGTAAQSSNVLRKKISNGGAAGVVDKRMKDGTPKVRTLNSGEKRVKKSKGPPGSKETQVSEDDKKRVTTLTAVEKKTTGINRKKKSKPEKKEEAKKTTNVQRLDQKTQRSEEK